MYTNLPNKNRRWLSDVDDDVGVLCTTAAVINLVDFKLKLLHSPNLSGGS